MNKTRIVTRYPTKTHGSLGNTLVIYNQEYKGSQTYHGYSGTNSDFVKIVGPNANEKALEGSGGTLIASKTNYPSSKAYNSPGGNYLSNEIFYRVAKLREEWITANTISGQNPPTKSSGHFHIAKLQETSNEDFNISKTQSLLNKVLQAINKGVTGL